jgi:hypothetical protein
MVSEHRICKATLRGVSPYSARRAYELDIAKEAKESHATFEERTWRNGMHTLNGGEVVIPGMAFKKALDGAAAWMGEKIKGQGQKTWTKRFVSGVLVMEPMRLGVQIEDVACNKLFVPSDGKPGGGKRVVKFFGRVDEWEGTVDFHVVDPLIENELFERYLGESGKYIGVGCFRPERGGYYGRFEVVECEWLNS